MNDTSTPPNGQALARQARLRDALRANLKKRRAQIRGRAASESEGDEQGSETPAAVDANVLTKGDQR